ncbi:MAG: hypothetical protein ACJ0Q2_00140 [Candidatus Azotimanducaceae bacterium]|jgi:hypothetical protein|tara:strand:- start:637 stop:978 length:342 start_codon:yes stop_codon:yes gene_type:complete
MPEVSGYGSPETAILQKTDKVARSTPTQAADIQSATQRGVEVVLSSQEARADLESYQELNRPVQNIGKPVLSELEQRALDDVKVEQRNSIAVQDQPEPSELSEREQRSLDALL